MQPNFNGATIIKAEQCETDGEPPLTTLVVLLDERALEQIRQVVRTELDKRVGPVSSDASVKLVP